MTRWIVIIVGVLLITGLAGGTWWYMHRDTGGGGFQTVPIARGELRAVISATGTVEPEEVIDVGAQIQGQIDHFGNDSAGKPVDFNSQVDQGMLLAHIDDALFKADVDSAQAAVESAKANVTRSQADLAQMNAKLGQAQADWERAQKIGPSDALAQTTYDQYRFAFDTAKANVDVSAAGVVQAQKAVVQAEATLARAKRNLEYCTITSPVKGTIISRRVNIGQTVVASLNAPSLFLLARDLTKMEVWASVNEADIGNIKAGQPVTFTVDAAQGRTFHGTVGKVRMDATMTQNVVTYTVEISVDNSDLILRPYLTANASIQVAKHDDVILVPNAALRWSPSSPDLITPASRNDAAAGGGGGPGGGSARGGGGGAGGGPGGANPQAAPGGGVAATTQGGAPTTNPSGGGRRRGGGAGGGGEQHRGTVWVADGKFVKPVRVRLGLTDGVNTEITSDEVKEGEQVVTGEIHDDTAGGDDAKNPFAPKFGGRRGGGR